MNSRLQPIDSPPFAGAKVPKETALAARKTGLVEERWSDISCWPEISLELIASLMSIGRITACVSTQPENRVEPLRLG